MEQRLQDIANLFNPLPAMGVGMGVSEMSPYSHYPTHYPYQVWKYVFLSMYVNQQKIILHLKLE